jgi:hypothetical protein
MGLTFEFFGGPRDGEVLVGGSGCLQCGEIQRRCHEPHGALIGQRIHCVTLYSETISETCSDAAIKDFVRLGCRFANHTYEVFWQRVDGSEIRVGLRHVGPASGGEECRVCPLRELRFPS